MIESRNASLTDRPKGTAAGIDELLEIAGNAGYAVAIWRSPGYAARGIIDDKPTEVEAIELENSEPGFYLNPFSPDHPRHFIKASIQFTFEGSELVIEQENEQIEKAIQEVRNSPASIKNSENSIVVPPYSDTEKTGFVTLVRKARERIREGLFQKVVPSRRMKLKIHRLSAEQMFNSMIDRYPNAFVSITYTPSTGIWIGASPEILVHTKNGKYFETVSLAGTQPLKEGQSLQDVAWRQKEIEEQAYVSRYIINCFKKIRLREFDEIGPKTIVAGNLIHLKSTFRVDMEAVNFPQLGSVMLDLLHPTSAVCGMPRNTSFNWLAENEGYDRKYFSGFLGPVNIESETSLYVNLRCMNIEGDQAWLYAGAGVTEDSNPEKEWVETTIKMNTLLDIIK